MIQKFRSVKIWVWGSVLGSKKVMDKFWRFSKLRKVNIWYIREKGVFRKVLVVWNKIRKVLD